MCFLPVCVCVCKCGTHGLQPAVVELVAGDVRARTDKAVLGAGHEAAGDAHLSGDLVWTLLDLRLQQDRLAQRTDEGIFSRGHRESLLLPRSSTLTSCEGADGL